MRYNRILVAGLLAIVCIWGSLAGTDSPVLGQTSQWSAPEPLLQTGDPAPGGGTFSSFSQVKLNNEGHVAFSAQIDGSSTPSGIFLMKDGQVSKVIGVGDLTPSGEVITSLACEWAFNDRDEFAWEAYWDGGGDGLFFKRNDGNVFEIARVGQETPIGKTYLGSFTCTDWGLYTGRLKGDLDVNNDGSVTFGTATDNGWYDHSGEGGLFAWHGGSVSTAVEFGKPRPDGGVFDYLTWNRMNDAREVMFVNWSSGGSTSALFTSTGGNISRVLGTGDPLPDGLTIRQLFEYNFPSSVADTWPMVISVANGGTMWNWDHALYIRRGQASTKIVADGDVVPSGWWGANSGTISLNYAESWFHAAINSQSQVVFLGPALLAYGSDLYAWSDGSIEMIDGRGGVQASPSINERCEIVYIRYSGGTTINRIRHLSGTCQPRHSRQTVMFITGIGSAGGCEIDDWSHIWDALRTEPGMANSNFIRFMYSDGGDAVGDCSTNPNASYTKVDTCWSIDNSPLNDPGTEDLWGQGERLAMFLESYLSRAENSDVDVSIIGHSEGGALAAYAIKKYQGQQGYENLDRVKTIVTLDSPLHGYDYLAADSLKAKAGCGSTGDAYDSAYDMTTGYMSHVISRIQTPGRPAARLFTVHEKGSDQLYGPIWADAVNDSESRAVWESDHIEVETGNHGSVWNGSGPWAVDTAILDRFISCAVGGKRPAGQCREYAESMLGSINVPLGQTATTNFDIPQNTTSVKLSAEWCCSTIVTTLVSPAGRVVDSSTVAVDVAYGSSPTSEEFEMTNPEPGEWTVQLYGADVPEGGEPVYVSISVLPLWSIDNDGDLIRDDEDNCPAVWNPSQADADIDGIGDACDPDNDNDGVLNASDNCEFVANPDQTDANQNGIGDACDPDLRDLDGDAVLDGVDNCPFVPNPGQADINGNGIGDACEEATSSVGGIAELPDQPGAPQRMAESPRGLSAQYAGIVCATAASVLFVAAAGWHAKRRRR